MFSMEDLQPESALYSTDPHHQKSLRGLVNTVIVYRYILVRWALVPAVIVAAGLLFMTDRYTTSAAFVPQPKTPNSSLPGIAAQLGVMLPMQGDLTESPQFYADLAESRRVLEAVVDSPYTSPDVHGALHTRYLADWLNIRHLPSARRREETIKKLRSRISVRMSQKTGVITIGVTTNLPVLSKQIADHFLSEINRFNLESRQSQARAEREFTEQRVRETGVALRQAEDQAEMFAQQNRGSPLPPRLALEQDRLMRNVTMQQDVYTAMVHAYEQAKIDEIRNTPVITVVQVPEVQSEPDPRHLGQKSFLAACLGILFGFAIILLTGGYQKINGVAGTEKELWRAIRCAIVYDLRHPFYVLGRICGVVPQVSSDAALP